MYIHAYQSLIWNEMVSKRMAQFGLNVVEGDLVYADEIDEVIEVGNSDDENEDETEEDASTEKIPECKDYKVKVITKEDIESNLYSIFDVVLPLPGFDVQYPTNECAEWYAERLAIDNLTSEQFKQKNK